MRPRPLTRRLVPLLVVLAIATACVQAGAGPSATPSPTGSPAPSASAEGAPPGNSPSPSGTGGPGAAPTGGEVPAAILDAAKADLAKRTGLDPATFTVIRADAVVWADGSLGCPVPGMMYVQMVTPGYWIVLGAGGASYDYRSGRSGPLRLCDQPSPKPPIG